MALRKLPIYRPFKIHKKKELPELLQTGLRVNRFSFMMQLTVGDKVFTKDLFHYYILNLVSVLLKTVILRVMWLMFI